MDPKFQVAPDDTARFIAKLTDKPLISRVEEVNYDEALVRQVGDAVIRREGVFPLRKLEDGCLAVLMSNPLGMRGAAAQQAKGMVIEEVSVAPASLIDMLVKKIFKVDTATVSGVDITKVVETVKDTYDTGGHLGTDLGSGADLENENSAPVIELAEHHRGCLFPGASDIISNPRRRNWWCVIELMACARKTCACPARLRMRW